MPQRQVLIDFDSPLPPLPRLLAGLAKFVVITAPLGAALAYGMRLTPGTVVGGGVLAMVGLAVMYALARASVKNFGAKTGGVLAIDSESRRVTVVRGLQHMLPDVHIPLQAVLIIDSYVKRSRRNGRYVNQSVHRLLLADPATCSGGDPITMMRREQERRIGGFHREMPPVANGYVVVCQTISGATVHKVATAIATALSVSVADLSSGGADVRASGMAALGRHAAQRTAPSQPPNGGKPFDAAGINVRTTIGGAQAVRLSIYAPAARLFIGIVAGLAAAFLLVMCAVILDNLVTTIILACYLIGGGALAISSSPELQWDSTGVQLRTLALGGRVPVSQAKRLAWRDIRDLQVRQRSDEQFAIEIIGSAATLIVYVRGEEQAYMVVHMLRQRLAASQ